MLADACESHGSRPVVLNSTSQAAIFLEKEIPSFIFLDAALADRGGIFRRFGNALHNAGTFTILLVGPEIKKNALKSLQPWVHDYLRMPIVREIAAARIKNLFRMKELEASARRAERDSENWLDSREAVIHNFQSRDISESFLIMARALALATDSHGDNGAHVRRMNEYARTIAEHMSLPESYVRAVSYSAQLHDVGKIYIHPDLLQKPLRLTPHEFKLVKTHPVLGAKILGESPMLRVAKNIALTHHECWDGSGYPSGLSGDAIPLEGAIVKIADVYDAIRTMHSYKSPYSHEDTCRMILEGGGDGIHEVKPSHFNPDALRAFQHVRDQFERIYQQSL